MAHFAQLDENNNVINVIVVGDKDTADENGVEKEEIGIAFCKSLFGEHTIWKQTSYNHKIRRRYAGIGGTYDPVNDAFINIKTFDSWVLNPDTLDWEAPIPMPDDGKIYDWDEENLRWEEIHFIPPT